MGFWQSLQSKAFCKWGICLCFIVKSRLSSAENRTSKVFSLWKVLDVIPCFTWVYFGNDCMLF